MLNYFLKPLSTSCMHFKLNKNLTWANSSSVAPVAGLLTLWWMKWRTKPPLNNLGCEYLWPLKFRLSIFSACSNQLGQLVLQQHFHFHSTLYSVYLNVGTAQKYLVFNSSLLHTDMDWKLILNQCLFFILFIKLLTNTQDQQFSC